MVGPRFVLVALALLPATVLAQQDAPPRTARLAGTVIADDTGLPIEGASVRLFGATQTAAATDELGRFELENIAPGSYFITGVMAGYALGVAGQRHPADTPTLVDLQAGSLRNAEIRLTPLGVLSGRIIDTDGRPVQKATISVVPARGRGPCPACRTATDAGGQYRIAGLPDGRYYVMASTPRPRTQPQTSSDLGLPQPPSVASTYYPGTALPSQASAVDVAAGRHVDASFTLAGSVATRIAGIVVDARGAPATSHVVLLEAKPPQLQSLLSNLAEVSSDGRFEFNDVPPGDYTIVVRDQDFFKRIVETGSSHPRGFAGEQAERRISVPGNGLDAINIRTQGGYELTGTVVMNGQPLIKTAPMAVITVPAEYPTRTINGGAADVASDGTFRLTNVLGHYLIRVTNVPAGTMVQRVLAGGVDVTDEGIDVVQPTTIEIVVGRRTELTGRLTTRRGTPVPGMSVVIFPENPRRWEAPLDERYVRSVAADAAGRFSVAGLPAGRYHVATVIAQAEGRGTTVSDFALLVPRATLVTLGDGDVRSVDLRID
jgi:hypothetical protein